MLTVLADTTITRALPWGAFWESAEFWRTGLPAWLQGIGTIAAVWMAGLALRSWQLEDAGKRKAHEAGEILKLVHSLWRAARRSRFSGNFEQQGMDGIIHDLDFFQDGRRQTSRDTMSDCALELETRLPVAKFLFGREVSGAMVELTWMQRELEEAYREVDYLVSFKDGKKPDDWEKQAIATLRKLGVRYDEAPDDFFKSLAKRIGEMEAVLVPFVVGKR